MKERNQKNLGGKIGLIIGIILTIILIILFIIYNGFLQTFNVHNLSWILTPALFLIFMGYILGSLVQLKKYILLGGLVGGIFGFLSPWLIQLPIVNFICPSISGLPQYNTRCIGDFYLSLFGTKFSGGNWHLLFYIQVFMIVWAIVGVLIGLIISKLKRAKR